MFKRNGKKVNFITLEPNPRPLALVGTELNCTDTAASLRTMAIDSARDILIGNIYSGANPDGTYTRQIDTDLGMVSIYGPLDTTTRVVQVNGVLTPASDHTQVIAKSPSHATHRECQVPVYTGVVIGTPITALLEAALAYVTTELYARGAAGISRLARSSTALDTAVDAYKGSPVGATFSSISDGAGLWITVPNGVRVVGTTKPMALADTSALTARFMNDIIAAVGPAADNSEIAAAIGQAVVRACGRLVNVDSLGVRTITTAEKLAIKDNMASFVAQPLVLLDLMGASVDEVDSVAFVDLMHSLALKINADPELRNTFTIADAPRSLGELLWFTVGIRDTKFINSVDCFYHRGIRPTITPIDDSRYFPLLQQVHPAFLDGSYTVDASSDGRTLTITNGGRTVTAEYPDWLGQDVSYVSTTAASAADTIGAYHALIDYSFGLLTTNSSGDISPQHLLHLGFHGVSTSGITSLRA